MAQKNLSIKLSLNDKQFQSSLRKATRSLKKFGSSMKRTGQNMTRTLTMPLLALGGASVKLASDFETSMTKISTLVGASAKDLKEYEKGIMQLSDQVGISAKELADGLFFITSAGFEGAEALEALEISAKASAMGMGEMSSISNALTSIMTAYADEQMTAAKAGDLLHETLKQGKFDAGQFMEKLGSVIPVAAGAGVSMEELGAASATMSKLSGDAAGTLTAMRSLMLSLLKPSEKQKEILADIGMTSEQLGKMMDESLLGTMQHLFKSLDGNNEALFNMFGSSKAVVGALSTMGLQSETYTKVLDGMNNSVGNINEGFDTLSGTSGFKFKQTLVKLQNVGIEIGNILLPIVIDLADGFKNILDQFNKLSPEAKKMSVAAGILVGALGPLLVVLGSIVGIVAGLSIKFIAIAVAIGALAFQVLYVNDNWEAFIERFEDISWWKNALLEMIALLIEYNPITSLFNGFNKFLDYLKIAQIPNPFEKGADFFRDMKTELQDYENDFQDFGTFIDNQGKKIKKSIKNIAGALNLGGGSSGGGTSNTNTEGLGPVAQAPIDPVANLFSTINANLPFPQIDESPFTGLVVKTEEEIKKLTEAFNTMQMKIKETEATFSSSFGSMSADADTSFRDIGNAALNSARQVIKAAIGQAIASQIAKIIATVPFPFNAVLAAGAGTAVSALFDKAIPAFAEGGLVTGSTLGLIGEGPGTSMSNPEVIAPLDKLQSMIGKGQGSVEVFGRISGSDILISSDRARKNRDRTRGY